LRNNQEIPRFVLYGEDTTDVEMDFLHLETIRVRSSLHDWIIRPHAHPEHAQVFLVTSGRADLTAEGRSTALVAPALFVIPAGTVHGMRFEPGSDGFVLTLASAYGRALAAADATLSEALADLATVSLDSDDAGLAEVTSDFERLARDFVWPAPGRRAAIGAHTVRILVFVLRHAGHAEGAGAPPRRDADLLRTFRERVERDFRKGLPVGLYARGLAVTQARLNAACRRETGRSASRIIHDRVMLEAKRNLLYTGMSVAEVAHAVGFADPAYFSRFFARFAGEPPGRFRAGRSEDAGGAAPMGGPAGEPSVRPAMVAGRPQREGWEAR
jgi:AraC family transcriptional regulator, transcriptional activator of pobA